MRIGQNPLKSAFASAGVAPVVLAIITHLPNTTTAYHSKRFDVIQACLNSMRDNANMDVTVLVWDNGSIPEFRNWLQFEYKPDMLVLSGNIGKISARTMIYRMFKPETIIAYSDDDMLYEWDWLQPQMDLLQHFPNVSLITGYPVRTNTRWGIENTVKWAMENARLEIGRFFPEQWRDDFALSVGRTVEFEKEYEKDDKDYRVTYQGKQAYCVGHHCQFIGYAGVVSQIDISKGLAMGDEKPFDIAMDKLGLRLATIQRYARHIGNVLDDEIKKELYLIGA